MHFLCTCVCTHALCVYLSICPCTMCVPGTQRGQKRSPLDPLELEFQAVVIHQMDSENQTQVLRQSSQDF